MSGCGPRDGVGAVGKASQVQEELVQRPGGQTRQATRAVGGTVRCKPQADQPGLSLRVRGPCQVREREMKIMGWSSKSSPYWWGDECIRSSKAS